ncbi:MAG: hypothetical protein MUF06_04245 [Pirellulaceae bacterium]|nr:hypothetical protein [Pirellulaceae bacterium]
MFKSRQLWQVTAVIATLTTAAVAAGDEAVGRLATYEKAPGESYFALSVMPKVAAQPTTAKEVVVLFDTSASQAGTFRDDALVALDALLKGLGADDRVKLMAVDVKAVPMTAGFVAAGSEEMALGLAKLRQRVPLGATDMDAGLRTAAASFASAEAAKTIVYLGDGMSKAKLPSAEWYGALTADLAKQQVTVSSFAIGNEQNMQFLASLANHTGGVVAADSGTVDASVLAGNALAKSLSAGVIWPTETTLPASVQESFPASTPPLRTDRDSVLIGKLSSAEGGEVKITGQMNGQTVELVANVMPEKSNEDFAFLPKLVEMAEVDRGLTLPTVGSDGLRQAAKITMTTAEELAKLGHEALAAGNVKGALQVAEAALARDPKNPNAIAVREAASKLAAGVTAPPKIASEPELKLASAAEPAASGSLLEEVLAEPPGFLADVRKNQELKSQILQNQVDKELADARQMMGENPDGAEAILKQALEMVESSPDLLAEVRAQLRQKLENALRQANQQKIVVADSRARGEEIAAAAREQEQITQALLLRGERLKQLVDRFTSLMAEGRYDIADDEIIPEIQELAPNTPIAASVITAGRFQRNYQELSTLWQRRQDGFLRTLYQVEVSHVPFPDEPPIVYPDPVWWEKISLDRKRKYSTMDLLKPGGAEQKIYDELGQPARKFDFIETPLKDVVAFLAAEHEIPIELKTKTLTDAGVNIDTPITKSLSGITLRSALRILLSELELTYMVKDEVLQITTPEDAESPDNMVTKVYNVGDLVVPIQSGGMGAMGGGMGMMGMGGMGMGGMGGGMMGGMGGMGGMGMGGMGGGMGGMGGMFAVEEELSLGTKKTTADPAPAVAAEAVPQPAKAKVKAKPLSVTVAAGETVDTAWDKFFAAQKAKLVTLDDAQSATRDLLAQVRETVRQRMDEQKFGEIVAITQAALRHGIVESWMYEAMGIAMQADHASPEDLDRALMSAVDFATTPEEMMYIALFMDNAGLHTRALSLYRQVGDVHRDRPEPFFEGLKLAQRLNDIDGIQWATAGLLRQSWTSEQLEIPKHAFRVAKDTFEKLLAAGKQDDAAKFDAAIQAARQRDVVVEVSWTGDADVDLLIEEPAGTICSSRQQRTTSGGVHLGDVAASAEKSSLKGFSETYVCSEGFGGEYRVLLKNIWGRPTGNKVTIDIYTDYGTPEQRVIHQQIPLGEKNAVVTFDVPGGRRKDALPEAQVANIAKVQNAMNRQILAQQLAGMQDTEAARNFALAWTLANQNGLGMPFFRRGAVGYRPVIQNFPEGAGFQATAVISADRRYVRITPFPFFSQINEVSTFNFVTGDSQTQGGGQGAGGGIGFGGGQGGGFF